MLIRLLGPQNLELAEDVVQEAFVAALRDWSIHGVPDNPPAWLLTAARRRAIDAIRRERTQTHVRRRPGKVSRQRVDALDDRGGSLR